MKKITLETKPKLIKFKDINTVEFRLLFPIKHSNENHFYLKLLRLFITTTSQQIPNQMEFQTELLRKLILNITLGSRTLVDNTYIIFAFSVPKEGLVKDFDLEDAFKFAIDALYNPLCANKEFDNEKFEYEKSFLVENHLRALDGIYAANANKFYEAIDPENELGNTYEEDTQFLENLTSKDLYEFYQKNIVNNTFIPYVFGDISETKVKQLFKTYAPQDKKSISFNINYYKPIIKTKCKLKEVITPYNQSELFLQYQVENMKESERKYLSIIINLLKAPENNLIFEALRIKNNLVYDVRVSSFSDRAMFVITAFISPENKQATKKVVNQVFKSLKDKEYLQECVNKLLKGLEVDLLKEEDNPNSPIIKALDNDFLIPTTEDILAIFKKVKINDLIKFLDRIKLTNEVLFKGDAQ